MSVTTGTRRRLVVLDSGDLYEEKAFTVGDIVCLVRNSNTNADRWTPAREVAYWSLEPNPLTNLSREECWDGWLGAFGSHSRHAHGAYRVVSVRPHDSDYAQTSAADWVVVSLVKVDTH